MNLSENLREECAIYVIVSTVLLPGTDQTGRVLGGPIASFKNRLSTLVPKKKKKDRKGKCQTKRFLNSVPTADFLTIVRGAGRYTDLSGRE